MDAPVPIIGNDLRRFFSKITFTDSCWLWTGDLSRGYGEFSAGGRARTVRVKAHRFLYEMLVGPIPDGLGLDHLCHTRAADRGECPGGKACTHRLCVRPSHMDPVTTRENVLRGLSLAAQNARKTRCKRGHEFTDENTRIAADGSRNCRACARLYRDNRKVA